MSFRPPGRIRRLRRAFSLRWDKRADPFANVLRRGQALVFQPRAEDPGDVGLEESGPGGFFSRDCA
jgi:hypothetical protein